MKVLIASSEAYPYAKTGGLGDVIGSLYRELKALGTDVRLVIPLYKGIKKRFPLKETGQGFSVPLGRKNHQFHVFSKDGIYFLECPEFFDRREIYGTSQGDYEDNAQRFIAFSRGVLEMCHAVGFVPDIIHCNDWQTAIIPLYIKTIYKKTFTNISTILTIHNLGYQGIFPQSAMTLTGLDMKLFNPDILEFYGKMNLLKAGIVSANVVSTVSPTYAREIKTPEYGFGLHGVLSKKEVAGITNGIDYKEWDPAKDPSIAATYSHKDLSGKKLCKGRLVKECGLENTTAPVAGMVGRIASQKGIDLLLEIFESVVRMGLNLVILGKGEDDLQRKLKERAKKYHGRAYVHVGFDETLAHEIMAGCDLALMPSRYEPCGLSQLISMRYGTVPVARATGGIADTVDDYNQIAKKGSGFLFREYSASSFEECLKRALCVYSDEKSFLNLSVDCMKKDFSWRKSAAKYIEIYGALQKKVSV